MKQSMKKTAAFICALALTASPITFSTYALPAFAEEAVAEETVSSSGEVTQEQIEENIVGTWILAEKDGAPALTNEKIGFNIVSTTEGYSWISRVNGGAAYWNSGLHSDVDISGNVVTMTLITEDSMTVENQLTITDMSSDKFSANLINTFTREGAEPLVIENVVTFVKVDDLSEAVLGTWEGKCTSESSVFDDGKEHRWEYKADGTYLYYSKVGDEWVADASENSEYFVAGNLLCTRWTKDGVENREWWEISVEDGHMSWTALRANDDGSTYTATFEMDKVEGTSGKTTPEQTEKKNADTNTTSPKTTTNPKTSMSGAHKALAGLTALMMFTGIAKSKKSRKEDKD